MLRSRDVRNHHCSSCCLTDKRRRRTLYTSLSRSTTVCHTPTPTSEPLYQGKCCWACIAPYLWHRESSPASSCHARLDRALPTAMAAASGRAPSACALLLLFLLLVVGAAAAAVIVVDANRGEQEQDWDWEQLSAASPSPWSPAPAPAPSPVSFIGKTPPPSRTWWMPYTLRFCVHVLND